MRPPILRRTGIRVTSESGSLRLRQPECPGPVRLGRATGTVTARESASVSG